MRFYFPIDVLRFRHGVNFIPELELTLNSRIGIEFRKSVGIGIDFFHYYSLDTVNLYPLNLLLKSYLPASGHPESGNSQEAVNFIAYTLSTLLLKHCEQEQYNQAFASKTNTKLL